MQGKGQDVLRKRTPKKIVTRNSPVNKYSLPRFFSLFIHSLACFGRETLALECVAHVLGGFYEIEVARNQRCPLPEQILVVVRLC